jgi:hypothetical protein
MLSGVSGVSGICLLMHLASARTNNRTIKNLTVVIPCKTCCFKGFVTNYVFRKILFK